MNKDQKIIEEIENLSEIKTIRTSSIGKLISQAISKVPSSRNIDPHTRVAHELSIYGGARELGSGIAATTIARPDDNSPVYKLYSHDPGYEKFLAHARENQDNPHFPKIMAVGKVPLNKEKTLHLRGVKMERLQPLSPDHPLHDMMMDRFSGFAGSSSNVKKHLESNTELKEKYPKFHKTLNDLADRSHYLDLHPGNIMQRKDGTPVITDPYVEDETGDFRFTGNPIERTKLPSMSNTELLKALKEEAPTNNVGSGNIAGVGVGPKGEPGRNPSLMPMVRRSKDFGGKAVFSVPSKMYDEARLEKRKYQRWTKYLDENSYDELAPIREYANAYPNRPIIIENEKTGAMCYIKYGKE